MVPLAALGQFAAHEEQALAGVGVGEAVVGAEVGELAPLVAAHLVYEGALAVDHLVVGERQHEVFVEGVDEREG